MKAFRKRFDLTDIEVINKVLVNTEKAHWALQQVEAGMSATPLDEAAATFTFLSALGYYPTFFSVNGTEIEVGHFFLCQDKNGSGHFGIEICDKDKKRLGFSSLFGTQEYSSHKLNLEDIDALLELAFPGGAFEVSDYTNDKGVQLFICTAREKYMQRKGEYAPVASGYSTCSNEVVAIMQATIRMVHSILVSAKLKLLTRQEDISKFYKSAEDTVNDLLAEQGLKWGERFKDPLSYLRSYGVSRYGKSVWKPEFSGFNAPWIAYDEMTDINWKKLNRTLKKKYGKTLDDLMKSLNK